MSKIGILVGSAPIGKEKTIFQRLLNEKDTYTIAADGGINLFLEEKVEPDEWIGDMDSATSYQSQGVRDLFPKCIANACSPIKDDTDTAMGVKRLFEIGCEQVYVFGGMGGNRSEHSIANIQLMHHYALNNQKVIMYSDKSEYYILKDENRTYSCEEEGFISVFALTDSAEVSIKGLFYEYEGLLNNSYALGVSNEFCHKEANIEVRAGVILIIRTEKM